MGKVVNLNKHRKQAAREAAKEQAAANRVRYGRSKEQKQRDARAEQEARRRLDGLQREQIDGDADQ